jgi:hypothetical protein
MGDDARALRIEQLVVKLEKDMVRMSAAIEAMAKSIAQFAEMHTEQQLLKQDLDNKYDSLIEKYSALKQSQDKVWQEVDNIRASSQQNAFVSAILGKLGYLVAGGIISYGLVLLTGG